MAIIRSHIAYYEQMFSIRRLLRGPALIFGFQEIRVPSWAFLSTRESPLFGAFSNLLRFIRRSGDWLQNGGTGSLRASPASYKALDLASLLRERGVDEVDCLDLFDERAQLHWDMNETLPSQGRRRYQLVIDIGSLEHVFDTRTCIDNMLQMVSLGGFIVLHTPVNGFFAHGFHVFNPEMLLQVLQLNGFAVRYLRFSKPNGFLKRNRIHRGDTIMWVVAERIDEREIFVCPQQKFWAPYYAEVNISKRRMLQHAYWKSVEDIATLNPSSNYDVPEDINKI